MTSIILPYGNAGWTEKRRIVAETLAGKSGAPFIYNDVLILVPSSRMKRMYGRLFLELAGSSGSAALVPPDILTLHQFLEKLSSRLSGPALMDENSRLILLEGLVKERLAGPALFNQSPDLLAPSLSAALAKMIEQLSTADVTPDALSLVIKDAEFFDKPQVQLLLDVLARYSAALKEHNLTDVAGLSALLRDSFDPLWLSRYSRIIIDGIQDAGRREAEILKKVMACGTCAWFIDAPSSELLDKAGEFHPLRIPKDFLSLVKILPEQAVADPDAANLYLAQALFSDKTFEEIRTSAADPASFTKEMKLLSAVNTREEVSLIAGMVKQSLKKGTEPDHILVAFPNLDEYGPLVEELFQDYGIPYNRALGRQLSASPVATAVISLLRACQEDFSGPSLLRIFSAPFLKFSEHPACAPALDRLMRKKRIVGGKDKLFAALAHHAPGKESQDVLTGPLTDLFSALGPFSIKDAAPLSLWMERLKGLISWSGLEARVAAIRGPLNVNLQAYEKMTDTLRSLDRAGKLFPEYTYSFNEWLFLVKKTFMHARFQVPPEDEGGVQILGLEESMGLPWKEIYFGGLVDSSFPQRLPQNIFLPEQTLEAMGVRTLEKARLNAAYHFYRLLLSAGTVTLTWPENQGDRPVVPSPFLQELTPLIQAGLLNRGMGTTSGIQLSLKIEESGSIPELAKAISLSGNVPGLQDVLSVGLDGMLGIKAALYESSVEQPTAVVVTSKRKFRVTELDEFITCPYKYSVKHVLSLEPIEEVTEDLSAMDLGSKVHAILRNFYLSWNTPVTGEKRTEAKALLTKLANAAFDREADTFRNRRDKELFLGLMAERFLDAEEEFWRQGMKPLYLEHKIDDYRLPLSNGESVVLSGKIDRIDVDADGNFVIVDYKTGKYPLPKMSTDQDIFQLPVYAVMAQEVLSRAGEPKNNIPLKKPIGLAYYDLSGKNEGPARDVVLFNKEARDDHTSSKAKASPKSAEEFDTILTQSMNKARMAVEDILAGRFPPKPLEENTCRYCENDVMCEKET